MFEATLKNRISAHFAPVTITFPIPEDQYEQVILALEKSQIGDARVQDCLIDNVHAPNCPALNRMTGTMANADELDWLGKQLESFNRYELLQFNAAVERFGLSAADELIDLSFCARKVTVISDFTDLEKTGKRHYLTVHGACDPKELENLDGKETALALISGQPGYVTRYIPSAMCPARTAQTRNSPGSPRFFRRASCHRAKTASDRPTSARALPRCGAGRRGCGCWPSVPVPACFHPDADTVRDRAYRRTGAFRLSGHLQIRAHTGRGPHSEAASLCSAR